MIIDTKKILKAVCIVLLIAALVICLIMLWSFGSKLLYPKKYDDYVEKYSAKYGVDETLVYAIIKTESSFDSNAVSDVGAIGLMQIMPETFEWLQTKMPGDEDLEADSLYEPEINIRYGVFFLSLLQEEFGDTQLVIAAYHAGRGQVNNWLADEEVSQDGKTIEKIPSRTTAHYVSKVTRNIEIYKKIYEER